MEPEAQVVRASRVHYLAHFVPQQASELLDLAEKIMIDLGYAPTARSEIHVEWIDDEPGETHTCKITFELPYGHRWTSSAIRIHTCGHEPFNKIVSNFSRSLFRRRWP